MLDERRNESPSANPFSAPEQKPPQLAKGTSERSKDSVQSMLVAGAAAFARDPASLNILRPVGNPLDVPPRVTYRTPVATNQPVSVPSLTVRNADPATARAHPGIQPESECVLLEILESGAHFGETIDAHNRRKERELGELFAKLSVREARVLHGRLSNPRPGDAIAERFARMIVARRHRLLIFLADARRREAMQPRR